MLLLEAGGSGLEAPSLTQPLLWFAELGTPVDFARVSTPQAGLGGRSILLSSGRILGGSGINAIIWLRPDVQTSERGVGPALMKPESRGRLALTGIGPDDPLFIDPAYLSAPQDRSALVEGLRWARELGLSSALSYVRAAEVSPGGDLPAETSAWPATSPSWSRRPGPGPLVRPR